MIIEDAPLSLFFFSVVRVWVAGSKTITEPLLVLCICLGSGSDMDPYGGRGTW